MTTAVPVNPQQVPTAVAMAPAVVRAIAEAVQPKAIVLFGSVARGTAQTNSDLDLAIIDDFAAAGRDREQTYRMVNRAIWDFAVGIDIVVFSPEEWQSGRQSWIHVASICAAEGKVVYGAL